MLVWIFIAAFWAGLLLLILHDAIRDAAGNSPISVASRNALLNAARVPRKLRKLRAYARLPKARPSEVLAPTHLATAHAQARVPTTKTESSKKTWWRKDRRAQITPAELEVTIAEAIRKSAPECDNFIGVIVHHKKPRLYRDPNWGVRGIKFGKADRRIVVERLPRIVEQLQKEYRLSDPRLRN